MKINLFPLFLRSILSVVILFPGIVIQTFSAQAAADPGRLLSVSISEKSTVLMLSIRCSRKITYRYFELDDPRRLVIDLQPIEDIQSVKQLDVQRRGLTSVRIGQYKWNTARVVIDFIGPVPPYVIEEGGSELTVYLAFPAQKERETRAITPVERPKMIFPPPKKKPPVKTEKESPPPPPPEKKQPQPETERFPDHVFQPGQGGGWSALRLEFQSSFYFPAAESVKKDYGNGITGGLELAVSPLRFLDFWVAARWIRGIPLSGSSENPTRLNIYPIEAGVKLRLGGEGIIPYLGAGAGLHFIQEMPGNEVISSRQWTFIGQGGVLFPISERLLFDVYFHSRFNKNDPEAKAFPLTGFHLGAGFGWRF